MLKGGGQLEKSLLLVETQETPNLINYKTVLVNDLSTVLFT
jgi:hypothetical protein